MSREISSEARRARPGNTRLLAATYRPVPALRAILAILASRGWHLGWGQRPPWDAGHPEHPDEAGAFLPSAIVVELFRRRTRPANRPRSES